MGRESADSKRKKGEGVVLAQAPENGLDHFPRVMDPLGGPERAAGIGGLSSLLPYILCLAVPKTLSSFMSGFVAISTRLVHAGRTGFRTDRRKIMGSQDAYTPIPSGKYAAGTLTWLPD